MHKVSTTVTEGTGKHQKLLVGVFQKMKASVKNINQLANSSKLANCCLSDTYRRQRRANTGDVQSDFADIKVRSACYALTIRYLYLLTTSYFLYELRSWIYDLYKELKLQRGKYYQFASTPTTHINFKLSHFPQLDLISVWFWSSLYYSVVIFQLLKYVYKTVNMKYKIKFVVTHLFWQF